MFKLKIVLVFFAFSVAGLAVADGPKADLAAIVEAGEAIPVDGITVTGQPDETALRVFSESDFVAVIDLRGEGESRGLDEPAAVEALGMSYVPLPIASAADITFDKARELDEILAGFDGPVLLHCGSGNRVGALLALRESLKGADDAEALEYGRNAGLTRLESVVQQRLDEAASEESGP